MALAGPVGELSRYKIQVRINDPPPLIPQLAKITTLFPDWWR